MKLIRFLWGKWVVSLSPKQIEVIYRWAVFDKRLFLHIILEPGSNFGFASALKVLVGYEMSISRQHMRWNQGLACRPFFGFHRFRHVPSEDRVESFLKSCSRYVRWVFRYFTAYFIGGILVLLLVFGVILTCSLLDSASSSLLLLLLCVTAFFCGMNFSLVETT